MPTPGKINNSQKLHPRVLVAPLDWGLGHATRCIPIIKELINQRCEVIIAASGSQRALLQAEFPSHIFVEIPGYDIKLDKNRAFTIIRLLISIPKILIRIKREKAWLRGFSKREKPDLVISDNRYGLTIPGLYCVFVTHQLLIKTPFRPSADRLLQWINYRFIRRFSRCWIPDAENDGGLAGGLSHPPNMPPIPHRYIGWLSRFGQEDVSLESESNYLLLLLSGPEPQRTLLEKIIVEQASGCPHPMVLVRGLPEGGRQLSGTPQGMTVHDHLPAAALGQAIRSAALVIARPGYSTLMDLARLRKCAVLVPTPGQSEQEYLGERMAARGWAVCMKQRDFSLAGALAAAKARHRMSMKEQNGRPLAEAIEELLSRS